VAKITREVKRIGSKRGTQRKSSAADEQLQKYPQHWYRGA